MGVFLDFYLWDLDGDELFQDATGFGHLLDEEGYYTATHVSYALGIYVAGESGLRRAYCQHCCSGFCKPCTCSYSDMDLPSSLQINSFLPIANKKRPKEAGTMY